MDRYRIPPDTRVDLSDHDPGERLTFDGKKELGREYLAELTEELRALQELLWAQGKHRVLLILQAMDSGGKDGVIRHVFRSVNPQGVKVSSFKAPSQHELDHDYLWRIHRKVPARGQIGIFNRSHYEDVLVVRVRDLAPREVWERRYRHVVDFERMLADEGTTILKFFLHISKDEQKERLQSRIDNPHKHWKFSSADLEERTRWHEYEEAFEAVLSRTSTPWAPWYVIPANSKWYRNLVVARILVETLEGLEMDFPHPEMDLEGLRVE